MKTFVAAMCAALVLMIGCNDDDSNCVTCPKSTPNPTLGNIWPNADKTAWTYQYAWRWWEGQMTIYATRDEVPSVPLPDWSEIFDLVQSAAPVEPYTTTRGIYRMQFDGMKTTDDGVTAQNLTAELFLELGQGVERHADEGTALLRRLYVARPDLREKIVSFLGSNSEVASSLVREGTLGFSPRGSTGGHGVPGSLAQPFGFPVLIHGGVWEKTDQWIGTYENVSPRLWWKFLADDLAVGSGFTYQLFPEFVDDNYLLCHAYRHVRVQTEVGTFEKALDCLYIVDRGITVATDPQGSIIGYNRMFDYGRVIYAPTIGPVYSYERSAVEPGNPPSGGFSDTTLRLVGSSTIGD